MRDELPLPLTAAIVLPTLVEHLIASRQLFGQGEDEAAQVPLQAALTMLAQRDGGRAAPEGEVALALEELIQTVRILERQESFETMSTCARAAARLAQDVGSFAHEAEAMRLWATASNFTGHFTEAAEQLRQAADLFGTSGDLRGQVRCLINLGAVRTNLGEHAEALSVLFQAHQLILGYSGETESLTAPCLVNIGHTYQAMRQYAPAQEYLHLGLDAARTCGDLSTQIAALGMLGLAHKSVQQLEQATATLASALDLAVMHGFTHDVIDLSDSLGQVWLEGGDYPRALEMHQKSLDAALEVEDVQGAGHALLGLGRAAAGLGRLPEAIAFLNRALSVTHEHQLRNVELMVQAELAAAHEQVNELAPALAHHKEFHRLERLLFNEESEARTQNLTARHADERARLEAESYRQMSEQAQRARDEAEQTVRIRTRELEQAQLEMVTRLGFAGEYRDDLTGAHTLRVGELSYRMAQAINMPLADAELLRWAARLHDIGKIGISDAVLLKPSRYTPDEYERMKLHTVIGAKMLEGSQSPLLVMAEQVALTHHERWDGQGYPRGLNGTEIPQVGRIVAVADVYDALTSERPYKPAWTPEDALQEIRQLSGVQFDPQVVQALEQVLHSSEYLVGVREGLPAPWSQGRHLPAEGAGPAPVPLLGTPAALPERADTEERQEQLRHLIGASWEQRGTDPQEGERLAREAFALAQELRHLWGLGYAYRNLGYFHFTASRYEEALSMLSRGLEFAGYLEDDVLRLDCANFSAAVYNALTHYEKAIDMLSLTMRVSRQLGDLKRTANTLHNLGVVSIENRDHDRAGLYLHDALSTYQAVGDAMGEAQTHATLSQLALERGQPGEAIALAHAALLLLHDAPNALHHATANLNLGKAHRQRGDMAASTDALTQALEAARALSHPSLEGWALYELGLTSLGADQQQDAQRCLQTALERARAVAQPRLQLDVYQALGQLAEASGDPLEALAYYRLHRDAEREIFTHDAALKTRALSIELEVERAKADTEIFKVRSIELTAANEALERVNAEKTRLLAMLETQSKLLERQVSEDALTGLYNRRYVEQALAQEFRQHKESGRPLTVAMVDLDYFKQINDRFSHMVGDQVLRQVALLFREVMRPGDIVARFGGEEFLIVLPGTTLEQGVRVCERLARHVTAYAWSEIAPALEVTLSVGVAADLSVLNHEKLVSLADARLYHAKATGRARVHS